MEFITNLNREKSRITLDHITDLDDAKAIKELTKYNGIGVKTASCVLLFAEGRNVCPVDTHVHRTVNRIGIVEASTPANTFSSLNEKFPPKIAHQFHTNLIRLGREICKPKTPSCGVCPLLEICSYDDKNISKKERGKKRSFMLLDSL